MRLKQQFVDDTIHYEIVNQSAESILNIWENFLFKNNLHTKIMNLENHNSIIRFKSKFKNKANIPYVYLLMKFKDPKRERPIMSYYLHPLKKLFNIAGRCLVGLTQQLENQGFILWKGGDLKEKYKAFNMDTAKENRFMMFSVDIKNMYTELPHDEIMQAVKFIMDEFSKNITERKFRRKAVTISLDKKNEKEYPISFGNNCSTNNKFMVSLTFKEIVKIINFDLNNVYAGVCNKIIKQKVGIPMGSPGSPPYAICLCYYYEAKIQLRLQDIYSVSAKQLRRKLIGLRYIDDLMGAVRYNNTPEGKLEAKNIIQLVTKECYHKNLIAKPEDPVKEDGYEWYNYLEGQFRNTNQGIVMRYHCKNWTPLTTGLGIKYLTVRRGDTFMRRLDRRNLILNTLCRIEWYSTNSGSLLESTIKCMTVLSTLGYSHRDFISAILCRLYKTKDPKWLELLDGMKKAKPIAINKHKL